VGLPELIPPRGGGDNALIHAHYPFKQPFLGGRRGSVLMVLSAEDRSTLTAPELLLSSMGLEDLFFIILMGVAGCCPCPPPYKL